MRKNGHTVGRSHYRVEPAVKAEDTKEDARRLLVGFAGLADTNAV